MHHLAMLHVGGHGVPQDYARAESLLQQAVAQGRTESESDLRFVQSALSDEKAEERRRKHDREVEERGRQARERAARAEQERQLALASATAATATDALTIPFGRCGLARSSSIGGPAAAGSSHH